MIMLNMNWTDKKLVSLNKLYITKILSLEELKNQLRIVLAEDRFKYWKPDFEDSEWLDKVLTLLRVRANTLLDIIENFRCFDSKEFDYFIDIKAVHSYLLNDSFDFLKLCPRLARKFKDIEQFTSQNIENVLRDISEKEGIKISTLCNATRVILTGQAVGASLFEIIELIGKETVVFRLDKVADDENYLLWLAEYSVQVA